MKLVAIMLWRCLALVMVLVGFIGLLLPVMPTVPFLIVALWAASKGWPSLEEKLINHPKYGADIRAWRDTRSIRRRAKQAAIIMMAGGYVILWFIPTPPIWAKSIVGVILFIVAIFIWTRPEIFPTENDPDKSV